MVSVLGQFGFTPFSIYNLIILFYEFEVLIRISLFLFIEFSAELLGLNIHEDVTIIFR